MNTTDGGIKIPNVPEVVIVPIANCSLYPALLIAPYITEPIAATVAGELPLIAAKIIEAKIAAIGSPPGR